MNGRSSTFGGLLGIIVIGIIVIFVISRIAACLDNYGACPL
jgi:hypothetical protein